MFPPRLLDENPPHRLRRRCEKMSTAIPDLPFILSRESQIGFMDQSRRLQRLPRLLSSQAPAGQSSQFVVYQRQKLLRSFRIASFDLRQNAGDIGHGAAGREMANDGKRPLRYPRKGQMTSFKFCLVRNTLVSEKVRFVIWPLVNAVVANWTTVRSEELIAEFKSPSSRPNAMFFGNGSIVH